MSPRSLLSKIYNTRFFQPTFLEEKRNSSRKAAIVFVGGGSEPSHGARTFKVEGMIRCSD